MTIKHKFLIAAIVLLIIPAGFVFAAPKAGITPDSTFYFFDTIFEKIDLFFTFSPEKKVKKNLAYAEERLAEAEEVAIKKKPEIVAETMAKYEANISAAVDGAKELKDKKESEKNLNIISDDTSKHEETLKGVLNKVPNEARPSIEHAIEVSTKQHIRILKEIEEIKKELGELKETTTELKQEVRQEKEKSEALQQQVEQLKTEKEKVKQCSAYNTLQLQIKDICGVFPYPGIDGCVWERQNQYSLYANPTPDMLAQDTLRYHGVTSNVYWQQEAEKQLQKLNKLKELKSFYLKAADGCSISLEEENKRSEAYIQEQTKNQEKSSKNAMIPPPRVLPPPFVITNASAVNASATRTLFPFYAKDTISMYFSKDFLADAGYYDPDNMTTDWDFGDGITYGSVSGFSKPHIYCQSGTFTLKAIVHAKGKSYTYTTPIEIAPRPDTLPVDPVNEIACK